MTISPTERLLSTPTVARTEADREDLFAEAVTLARRVEGRAPASAIPWIAGIKTNGDVSFYFGPDRVYHFDGAGRFRRGFVEGLLYRSQGDRLIRLRRDRTESETALLRSDLTNEETAAFLAVMQIQLRTLQTAITTGALIVSRRHPAEDDAMETAIAAQIDMILHATPWLAPALVVRR